MYQLFANRDAVCRKQFIFEERDEMKFAGLQPAVRFLSGDVPR
jgi:hypothetical protein